jgi:hypothetical protein
MASRGRRSKAGRRTSARPKAGGPNRPTDAESRTCDLDTQLRTYLLGREGGDGSLVEASRFQGTGTRDPCVRMPSPSGNPQRAGVTGRTLTRTASDLLRSRRPFIPRDTRQQRAVSRCGRWRPLSIVTLMPRGCGARGGPAPYLRRCGPDGHSFAGSCENAEIFPPVGRRCRRTSAAPECRMRPRYKRCRRQRAARSVGHATGDRRLRQATLATEEYRCA